MRMKSPQGGIEIAQDLVHAPSEEETGPPNLTVTFSLLTFVESHLKALP